MFIITSERLIFMTLIIQNIIEEQYALSCLFFFKLFILSTLKLNFMYFDLQVDAFLS